MWLWQVFQLNQFTSCLLFFISFPGFLSAGEGKLVKNGPVSTRFVVEKNIHPQSKIIEIGWWMKREKNWHTYWESPGDVGVPPTLKWELPKGIIFKKISYAPPQLVKMFKVFAHGHRDETLFICTFHVDRKLTVGETLKFRAKSSWLACYTTCLPTYDEMEITVPVESNPEIDNKWHEYFKVFWEEQPITAPTGWLEKCNAKIKSDKGTEKEFAVLRFPYNGGLSLPTFRFFADGRFVLSNIFQIPQRKENDNGETFLELEMELSYWRDPKQRELSGLLYRSDGWPSTKSKFYQISLPLDQKIN